MKETALAKKTKTKAIDPNAFPIEDARTLIAWLRGAPGTTWQQALHAAFHVGLFALEQLTPAEATLMKGGAGEKLTKEALAQKLEEACDHSRQLAAGTDPHIAGAIDWRAILSMILRFLPILFP